MSSYFKLARQQNRPSVSGNITRETIQNNIASTHRVTANVYDEANKLISRNVVVNGETTPIAYTYTYDDAGNMLTESKDGVLQKTYTYDKFDRLATYTAGDTTAQYTYNGDNLRQSKTVNNVTTQHLGTHGDGSIVLLIKHGRTVPLCSNYDLR